jgi:hypothetical protein
MRPIPIWSYLVLPTILLQIVALSAEPLLIFYRFVGLTYFLTGKVVVFDYS